MNKLSSIKDVKAAINSMFRRCVIMLLWQEDEPVFSQYLFFILNDLQILGIMIWMQFNFISSGNNDFFTHFVERVANIISVHGVLLDETSKNTIIGIRAFSYVYWCIGPILTAIYFYKYVVKRNLRAIWGYFYTHWARAYTSVIFWVTIIYLLNTLTTSNHGQLAQEYLEASHGGVILLNILIIVISILAGVFSSYMCYDPFRTLNLFSSRNTNDQMMTFFYKTISAFCIVLPENQTLEKWLCWIFSFAFSVSRLLHLHMTFPYYYYKPMRLAITFASIQAGLSFSMFWMLVTRDAKTADPVGIVYLQMILIAVWVVYNLRIFESEVIKFLLKKRICLKDEHEVFKKYFALGHFAENCKFLLNDNHKDVGNGHMNYLLGFISQRKKEYRNYLKLINKSSGDEEENTTLHGMRTYISGFTQYIISAFFTEATKRFKKSSEIKLVMAHDTFEKDNNFAKAVNVLYSIKLSELDFQKRVIYRRLKKKLENQLRIFFTENTENVLDVKSWVDYEYNSTHLFEMVINNVKNWLGFWELYKHQEIKMQTMYEKSIQIEKEADEIMKFWNSFASDYSITAKRLVPIFSTYLLVIRNVPYTSERLREKYNLNSDTQDHMSDDDVVITNQNIRSKRNVMLYISMSKETRGKILYCSRNISQAYGWSYDDVVGRNISLFMPSILQEFHTEMWKDSLTFENLATLSVPGFTITKAGHTLPAHIYITIFPYIGNELTYACILRPKQPKNDFLLLRKDGTIEGYSLEIGKEFGLGNDKKKNIRDICKNFDGRRPRSQSIAAGFLDNDEQSSIRKGMPRSPHKKITTIENGTLRSRGTLDELRVTAASITNSRLFSQNSNQKGTIDSLFNIEEGRLIALKFTDINNRPREYLNQIEVRELRSDLAMSVMYFVAENKKTSRRFQKLTKSLNVIMVEEDEKDEDEVPPELSEDEIKPYMGLNSMTSAPSSPLKSPYRSKEFLDEKDAEEEGKRIIIRAPSKELDTPSPLLKRSYTRRQTITKIQKVDSLSFSVDETDETGVRDQINAQHELLRAKNKTKMDEEEMSFGSSIGSKGGSTKRTRIEKAIHMVPKLLSMKLLHLAAICYIILCSVLMLVYNFHGKANLDLVMGNVHILKESNQRTFEMLEISRVARVQLLVEGELWSSLRYPQFSDDLKTSQKAEGGRRAVNLVDHNNEIRDSVHLIDKHLQEKLLTDLIPIVDRYSGVIENHITIFQMATEFAESALRMAATPNSSLTFGNTDINFLLKNALNDMPLVAERGDNILIEDSKIKMENNEKEVLKYMILALAFGFLIILGILREELKFVQNRNHFIEVFLRIDEHHMAQHIKLAVALDATIRSDIYNDKTISIIGRRNKTFLTTKSLEAKTNAKHYRGKTANRAGLNIILYLIFIFAVCLIILFALGFLTMYLMVNKNNTKFLERINDIKQVEWILVNICICPTALYAYIQDGDDVLVRNQPVSTELENILSRLKGTAKILHDLLEKDYKDDYDLLRNLITGNLCTMNLTPDVPASVCVNLADGAATKGMISINDYAVAAISNAKSFYDVSDKSFLYKKLALSQISLWHTEVTGFFYLRQGFTQVINILEENLQIFMKKHDEDLSVAISLFIVSFLILGTTSWIILWAKLRDQAVNWRKMVRLIPHSMILSNKALRHYLIKYSEHTLDNFT